jgi:hypothetical protein
MAAIVANVTVIIFGFVMKGTKNRWVKNNEFFIAC